MLSNNKQIRIICDNIKALKERRMLINEQRQISYELLLQIFVDNYNAEEISQSWYTEPADPFMRTLGKPARMLI